MSHDLFQPNGAAVSLHTHPSQDFAQKLQASIELLQGACNQHAHVVQASSLGAEDMVITELIVQQQLPIAVVVLNTGLLHVQTQALLERLQARLGDRVRVFSPNPASVIQFVRVTGQAAIYDSLQARQACCAVRKLEPLKEALTGQDAWVTGIRAEQSSHRAGLALRQVDHSQNQVLEKFNPLLHWSWGDVWHFIAQHKLDYNPLHDHFFPSIGCAPCTRAISLGEDFRAGRWWWESDQAKECGLHKAHTTAHPSVTSALETTS